MLRVVRQRGDGRDDKCEQAGSDGPAETILATGWDQPATRGWFAQVLWQALDSHWGVDRVE